TETSVPSFPPTRGHRFLFFFPCPCSPRGLPSFPTRRSSDLSGILRARYGTDLDHGASATIGLQHNATQADTFSCNTASLNNPNLDRKSTRLNSSHVATSYAVFCLKKKQTPPPPPPQPPPPPP